MKNLFFFLLKSKYPNPIQNNRTRTKNIRTRPEVQKYPNGFSIPIPKYPKIRNTRKFEISDLNPNEYPNDHPY